MSKNINKRRSERIISTAKRHKGAALVPPVSKNDPNGLLKGKIAFVKLFNCWPLIENRTTPHCSAEEISRKLCVCENVQDIQSEAKKKRFNSEIDYLESSANNDGIYLLPAIEDRSEWKRWQYTRQKRNEIFERAKANQEKKALEIKDQPSKMLQNISIKKSVANVQEGSQESDFANSTLKPSKDLPRTNLIVEPQNEKKNQISSKTQAISKKKNKYSKGGFNLINNQKFSVSASEKKQIKDGIILNKPCIPSVPTLSYNNGNTSPGVRINIEPDNAVKMTRTDHTKYETISEPELQVIQSFSYSPSLRIELVKVVPVPSSRSNNKPQPAARRNSKRNVKEFKNNVF